MMSKAFRKHAADLGVSLPISDEELAEAMGRVALAAGDRIAALEQELTALRELLAEIEWLPDYEADQEITEDNIIGYSAYEPPHRIKRLMELTKRNEQ